MITMKKLTNAPGYIKIWVHNQLNEKGEVILKKKYIPMNQVVWC